MKSIKINESTIDQQQVDQQLQSLMSQIPNLDHLSTSGSTWLHQKADSAMVQTSMIRPLLNYIPRTTLKETQFTSPTPFIGSLLISIRKGWNWMSTKWYMRPILIQQSNINSDLIMFLVKSIQIQEKQAEEIAQLEARIDQLEAQLQQTQEL